MNRYLIISGIVVLLICVGLSGCNEQQSVEVQNISPTVEIFGTPQKGTYPLTVSFTSQCTNLDYEIAIYFWSFGDGHYSIENNTTHTYEDVGNYEVTLQVSDVNFYEEGTNTSNSKLDMSNKLTIVVENDDYNFENWIKSTFGDIADCQYNRLEAGYDAITYGDYSAHIECARLEKERYERAISEIDDFKLSEDYNKIRELLRNGFRNYIIAMDYYMEEDWDNAGIYEDAGTSYIEQVADILY